MYKSFNFLSSGSTIIWTVENVVSILHMFSFGILSFFAGYYFYKFSIQNSRALETNGELDFNVSFQLLLKHIRAAALLFTLNSLFALITVYLFSKYVH